MHANNRRLYRATEVNQATLKVWREHDGPITDKLQASIGSTQLERVFQGWLRSGWWEREMFGFDDSMLFQREIIMRGGESVYWYARTLIPQNCFVRNPAFFNRLQHESIRNLIFNEPIVTRKELISYPIDKQCIEFHWVKKYVHVDADTLWVRLAEFQLYKQESFYLAEVLLPALEQVK